MSKLIFVTKSRNKFTEAERVSSERFERAEIDLPEIQAVEIEQVIVFKAEHAYRELGRRPVLVEDTGLFIDAWHGLPGALVRWFVERVGT